MSIDPHEPNPVEIHDSKGVYASYGVGMTILAAASATAPGWGPILAIAFGVHAVWALRRLVDRGPRIRITSEGIIEENFWYSLIRWEEIIDVRPTRFALIEVELRDEGAFLERLSPLRQMARFKLRLFGFGPALITPWGMNRSTGEVVTMLQEGLDQYVLESARKQVLPSNGEVP
jgi:hypothetical protein